MKASPKNKRVDTFLKNEKRWRAEYDALREIALSTDLMEDLKWGQPCYTLDNANIFLIHGFKEYVAVLFMEGAMMKDPKKLLIQQTPNVQAGRQLRFTSLAEITKSKSLIKSYMKDAIALQEAGIKLVRSKPEASVVPEEIAAKLKKVTGLWPAFNKLTPGRKRAYILHFSAAKQEKTVDARILKAAPAILEGKGLNE
jgi:uncharacterized protein YdeI (YjbR/CyaY-like superfamily)